MQKTYYPKPSEVTHDWYVVDAADQNLGRFATQVARLLLGKNKPQFTPGVDIGDFVIIVNAEKIAVTGKKLDDKYYYRHSGYPGGLSGMDIPLVGRIVALVDTFDAVTSNRPYKEAWDLERAFILVKEETGKQFDPRLVELFLGLQTEIRRIYEAHRDD